MDDCSADKNISELYLGKSKGILGKTERSGDVGSGKTDSELIFTGQKKTDFVSLLSFYLRML